MGTAHRIGSGVHLEHLVIDRKARFPVININNKPFSLNFLIGTFSFSFSLFFFNNWDLFFKALIPKKLTPIHAQIPIAPPSLICIKYDPNHFWYFTFPFPFSLFFYKSSFYPPPIISKVFPKRLGGQSISILSSLLFLGILSFT